MPGARPLDAIGAARTTFLSVALATVAACALDLLWASAFIEEPLFDPAHRVQGTTYTLGLGAIGGILLGIPVALVVSLCFRFGRRRPVSWRNPGVLAFGLLAVMGFVLQNLTTFQGAAISDAPARRFLEPAFFVAGGLVIFLAVVLWTRITSGAQGPRWLLPLQVLAAAAFFTVDATCYVGLYDHLHLQLAECVVACLALSVALLLLRGGRSVTVLAAAALVILAGIGVTGRFDEALPEVRAAIATRTVHVRQWMRIPEAPLALALPLPTEDGVDIRPVAGDTRVTRAIRHRLDLLLPERRDLNLLLVSIDALRADRCGFMGYEAARTPNLDALARRSIVFERARCQYPTSSQSFSSLFTGLHAGAAPVWWESRRHARTWDAQLSLAGRLAAHGFETVAETAFNQGTVRRRDLFGHLTSGFKLFNPQPTWKYRQAPAVTQAAIEQIERLKGKRFFLWTHFLDPHAPYLDHEEFGFPKDPSGRYDSEIAACDAGLGIILEALSESGRARDTVVIVLSDHGEEFGEHAGRYHCTSLYEEQVRVPLILHVPGLEPRRREEPVGLVDLLPTILELLALDDPHERSGRSLWPLLLSEGDWFAFSYAELDASEIVLAGGKDMVVHGGHKLIASRALEAEEVYDLAADPEEKKNLLGKLPSETLSTLRGLLRTCRKQVESRRVQVDAGLATETDPVRALSKQIEAFEDLEAGGRGAYLGRLFTRVVDLLQGVRPELDAVVRGPLREPLRAVLTRLLDPKDPLISIAVLRFVGVLQDEQFLPVARALKPSDPHLIAEVLVLRAILGDASAGPILVQAYELPGAPERHGLALALLLLGDERGLDDVIAAATTRDAIYTIRLLRALAASRSSALIPLAEQMLAHEYWRNESIRSTLVEALGVFASEPRRNRLLARLAADYSAEVALSARAALQRSASPELVARLLTAGAAEAEADEGVLHREFTVATRDMERAVELFPDPTPEMLSKLRALLDRDKPLEREPAFSIVGALGGGKGLPRQWNLAKVAVQNDGETPWTRGPSGRATIFRIEILDESGQARGGTVAWETWPPKARVDPGESSQLLLPFLNPGATGSYRLGVRMIREHASGKRELGPRVMIEDGALKVVPRLF